MSTPHNTAERGQVAATVLMPGDPLRAKFIAENFFDSPVQFNAVRGALGYTGRYKGAPVSVMGSGMGMPSIGIYSYELFDVYGVERIIRVGSTGAYAADLKLFDVILASAAYSESSYAKTQNGFEGDTRLPSERLNAALREGAAKLGHTLHEGLIHSSDVFYREPDPAGAVPYWKRLRDEKGCLAVEMESFALFHNAIVKGREAACLLTVSDSFENPAIATPEEREKSFTAMMQIALSVV